MTLPIAQQIAAVERECGMRRHVYPKWVAQKKISDEKARHELNAMNDAYATLCAVPLLTSACEELLHCARSGGADPEMIDRCSAALKAAGSRI